VGIPGYHLLTAKGTVGDLSLAARRVDRTLLSVALADADGGLGKFVPEVSSAYGV